MRYAAGRPTGPGIAPAPFPAPLPARARARLGAALLAVLCAAAPVAARAQEERPERIGQCVTTRVAAVGSRLTTPGGGNIPNSGSGISFTNGVRQVSCRNELMVQRARKDDRARLCLVRIGSGIPPTRTYNTTNQRTGDSWTLSDRVSGCI
ncbi:hypothetical protein M0638_14285 [Roseomonas sp. NAR14]|uniref:Uncharacterized protein n=1 Tax=Roseomonas acroporae TaxID=2937791 RepID=A0A9X1Y8N9_9PROT|nr:hypothetical protein [Roseomonas acroporae]MCK8785553.1 hypothetical protein [Roseomonas acroporae]